jgi:hypothetical protein
VTNWKARTYSKHSESLGKALKELRASVPSVGDGFGRPTQILEDSTNTTPGGYDDPKKIPQRFKTKRLTDQGR